MSSLHGKKQVFFKSIPILLLFFFSIQSVFAVVFDRLFETFTRTFAISQTNLALLIYWIIIFTTVYFVGNKSFDYFNKDGGSQGRKFAIIIGLVMATSSVVFTPTNLIEDVMRVYGTFLLPLFVLLIPGIMTISAYRLLYAGENRSAGKAVGALILFILAFALQDYLRTVFSSVFAAINPMGATMAILADIMILAQGIGGLLALWGMFGGLVGRGAQAARNAITGRDPAAAAQRLTPANTQPRPPPIPYNATQEVSDLQDLIQQLGQIIPHIQGIYQRILAERLTPAGLTNPAILRTLQTDLTTLHTGVDTIRHAITTTLQGLSGGTISDAQRQQLGTIATNFIHHERQLRADVTRFNDRLASNAPW